MLLPRFRWLYLNQFHQLALKLRYTDVNETGWRKSHSKRVELGGSLQKRALGGLNSTPPFWILGDVTTYWIRSISKLRRLESFDVRSLPFNSFKSVGNSGNIVIRCKYSTQPLFPSLWFRSSRTDLFLSPHLRRSGGPYPAQCLVWGSRSIRCWIKLNSCDLWWNLLFEEHSLPNPVRIICHWGPLEVLDEIRIYKL